MVILEGFGFTLEWFAIISEWFGSSWGGLEPFWCELCSSLDGVEVKLSVMGVL